MSKKIVIKKELDLCNKCPYFNEHVDTSVCYDSFDDPNYDWFCKHPHADNSGTDREQYNEEKYGKFIDGSLNSLFRDCKIPSWCPLEDVNLESY